ncbi:hypothetical protein FMUND_6882 [Fusarium mundagurra]|uniref:Uncharacterized protein n=1 Tax=Fusarium mundagurra TaxID=1567541 RepID=A0A8H5YMH5_9HYPO|nr:hypothetical protein FMUND_6882 [Fusarium mundagurra]
MFQSVRNCIYDNVSRAHLFAVRTSATEHSDPFVIGDKTFLRKTRKAFARVTRTRSIREHLAILACHKRTTVDGDTSSKPSLDKVAKPL